jgi:hypothetical protein
VGDADGGLQVIRVSDPESVNNASIVGNFDTLGYCKGVMVEGNHVFMADLGNGLRVIEFK